MNRHQRINKVRLPAVAGGSQTGSFDVNSEQEWFEAGI